MKIVISLNSFINFRWQLVHKPKRLRHNLIQIFKNIELTILKERFEKCNLIFFWFYSTIVIYIIRHSWNDVRIKSPLTCLSDAEVCWSRHEVTQDKDYIPILFHQTFESFLINVLIITLNRSIANDSTKTTCKRANCCFTFVTRIRCWYFECHLIFCTRLRNTFWHISYYLLRYLLDILLIGVFHAYNVPCQVMGSHGIFDRLAVIRRTKKKKAKIAVFFFKHFFDVSATGWHIFKTNWT